MHGKLKTLSFLLLLTGIITLSVNGYAAGKPSASGNTGSATMKKEPKQSASPAQTQTNKKQLIVYYFMTTYRCQSCTFIEGTTRKALDEFYANELKSGRIVFKMVNIEEPQNKHFVDEYGLYTKSVVLSDLKDGKQIQAKNLDKIWNLVGQEGAFKSYIAKEVQTLLGS